MSDRFKPLLTTTDWNEEWQKLQDQRGKADSAAFWNERAATFHCGKDAPNAYVESFIENLRLSPEDKVLDMGCGNGALAIPLAKGGHDVIAADFSAGMLSILEEDLTIRGLRDKVTILEMSWTDDWEHHGITDKCVDIAIASRSIATSDLEESLLKLTRIARKRAAITLSTSMSPRVDERILSDLGLQAMMGRDFLYAFNILACHGFHPSITYLDNDRNDRYTTREEAQESLMRMRNDIARRLPEEERTAFQERFAAWMEKDLVRDKDAEGTFWRLSKPRKTQWAFISWETDD